MFRSCLNVYAEEMLFIMLIAQDMVLSCLQAFQLLRSVEILWVIGAIMLQEIPYFSCPNAIESQWIERGNLKGDVASRPIDILVQRRKSSDYLLFELVPALRAKGFRVEIQSDWVEDIVRLFNDSKCSCMTLPSIGLQLE